MSKQAKRSALVKRRRRNRLIALGVGMVLALVCKSLPPDYQVVCDAIKSICTGSF